MAVNDTASYKRNDLSIYEKIALLRKYDSLPKCSQRKAALELHVSQPLLCKLLKNREALLNSTQVGCDFNRKRRRSGKESAIEEALFKWYVLAKQADLPINRRVLVGKAQEFANIFGNTNFKASDGWLSRWKQRNNISYKRGHQKVNNTNVQDYSKPDQIIQNVLNVSSQEDPLSIDDSIENSDTNQNDNELINESLVSSFTDSETSGKSNKKNCKDEVIDFSMNNEKDDIEENDVIMKQESHEYFMPTCEEAMRALLVIRHAVLGHSDATLEDVQSFYNIEECLNRIYSIK